MVKERELMRCRSCGLIACRFFMCALQFRFLFVCIAVPLLVEVLLTYAPGLVQIWRRDDSVGSEARRCFCSPHHQSSSPNRDPSKWLNLNRPAPPPLLLLTILRPPPPPLLPPRLIIPLPRLPLLLPTETRIDAEPPDLPKLRGGRGDESSEATQLVPHVVERSIHVLLARSVRAAKKKGTYGCVVPREGSQPVELSKVARPLPLCAISVHLKQHREERTKFPGHRCSSSSSTPIPSSSRSGTNVASSPRSEGAKARSRQRRMVRLVRWGRRASISRRVSRG